MITKEIPSLEELFGRQISRTDAINQLKECPKAYEKFQSFPQEFQEHILEFLQGIRGLPILYDSFFKAIFDPYTTPERLERFLSCLLGQDIQIKDVLTREGTQLVEKGALVIMDILAETKDGSFINVEMQKHGYEFTGERSTCYMSDIIMRQYNRVKSERKQEFSFKDMKSVYLIVLMEHSSQNLKDAAPHYIHRSIQTFDSGAEVKCLTNYIYISLDTFHSVSQNISSYLDAWFTFLSSDSPDDILYLIQNYPEFKEYYHDIALFRTKPEELMNMYSEALLQMDRNTVNLMIEDMKKELVENSIALAEKDNALAEKDNIIAENNIALAEKDNTIAEKDNTIAEQHARIAELEALLKQNK